jgi:hypothetical protein
MVNFVSLIDGIKNLIASIGNSTGVSDAGKIPHLDSAGKLDDSFIDSAVTRNADLQGGITSVYLDGLTSSYFKMGYDVVIQPVAGGQSLCGSWHGLQLGGLRSEQITAPGTPPPELINIEDNGSFVVGIAAGADNGFYSGVGTLNPLNVLNIYQRDWHTTGNFIVCKDSALTEIWGVDLNGYIYCQGTKVLGVTETGWTAGTGTPNKGAFDADIATLTEVSQRLLAIEQALRTHGLID